MTELKHWLDESSDADEFERSILRAGLEADPSEATQNQIWSNLLGTVAVAPLIAATTAVETASAKAAAVGVSKASAVWLAVAKGFVVGLAVYGASAGVSQISNRLSDQPAPKSTIARVRAPARVPSGIDDQQAATVAPSSEPTSEDAPSVPRPLRRGTDSTLAPAPTNREADLPSVVSFADPEHPSDARVSRLEEETRALRRARDELRAGNLTAALATLEASQRRFSAPELYQEREALMIELLARSGQHAAAEQRVRAFLARFPESPHAQQIRQFIER
jgi:hypothetical protein